MIANPAPRSLARLTAGIPGIEVDDIEVSGISRDSREVRAGDLFLAMPGAVGDGRDFIAEALAAGAAAVLAEAPARAPRGAAPVVEVPHLRRHAGTLADRFFDQPSGRLCVIGVTGTNGKTTCAHLLAQALESLGLAAGVLGTLGNGRLGDLRDAELTTLDVVSVHRELARLVAAGAESVCMEVSSHALDQGRVDKVAFDVAVFTNLSRDHLDYHADMAAYAACKARLFERPDLAGRVVNVDDGFGRRLAQTVDPRRLWTYGRGEDAALRLLEVHESDAGLEVAIGSGGAVSRVEVPLLGAFNAHNVLAVYGALLALGFGHDAILKSLARIGPAPGRMEVLRRPGRATVVIDYAHTPDALEKALKACRAFTAGRLIVVFGCGGDRDRDKRPRMGAVAAALSDAAVVTSDNPRGEAPRDIAADVRRGMDGSESVRLDRREAIAAALAGTDQRDTVLIAGKGHETVQVVAGRSLPFSDREVARALLEEAS